VTRKLPTPVLNLASLCAVFLGCFLSLGPTPANADEAKKAAAGEASAEASATPSKEYPPLKPGMGALSGKVLLKGAAPAPEELVVPKTNKDHKACHQFVKSERLVLSAKNEIRDVVISVAGYKPSTRPEPKDVTLDNKDCSFVPHVLAATKGSILRLTNSDKFMHNTHGLLGNTFNLAVIHGQAGRWKLRKAGWTPVQCDIHSWMKAHIHVFEHELFDVSSASGDYKIVNIPPGEYEIEVWHEKVAFSFQPPKKVVGKVKIEAGKTATLEIQLEAPSQ
jgi:plastocyanin